MRDLARWAALAGYLALIVVSAFGVLEEIRGDDTEAAD